MKDDVTLQRRLSLAGSIKGGFEVRGGANELENLKKRGVEKQGGCDYISNIRLS